MQEIVENETAFTKEKGQRANKKKRRRILIGGGIPLLLLAACVGGWFYVDNLAYHLCRVEAGVSVAPSDFLKTPDENAFFTENSQPFSVTEPGEYQVEVKSGWFVHRCTLVVEDTIPPACDTVPVQLELGETCGPELFVENVTDATAVELSFGVSPDFHRAGRQMVELALTDRGGNRVVVEAELLVLPVAEELTVEAGQGPPGIREFLLTEAEADFITQIDSLDYHSVGDYPVSLRVDGELYSSVLHIVDTVPPRAEVQDVEGFAILPRQPEDFVTVIEDATEVKLRFGEEPDLAYIGTQQVAIVFTDQGGNETIKTALLTLEADTEAPVITGARDMLVFMGDSVSYRKNVTVQDNCPDGLELSVDTSAVNLGEAGVYPVIYRAVDAAGNETSVTVSLTVAARLYSLEEVNALADAALAGIITPEMSERDKAWAIYTYIRRNVGYINHSEKGDWVRAAYEGLAKRQGDCYVYACTAKALLTRAGIKNMDIAKIPTKREHYWNLVDVGDGWYHFDTTPRTDHTIFFLWTDAELMEYSGIHYRSHNYDREAYPEIN